MSCFGWYFMHIHCTAQIVNLIVTFELKEIQNDIDEIRNNVKYIRSSPSRSHIFQMCVDKDKIKFIAYLALTVISKWNSAYLMLKTAFKFKKSFDRMEEDDQNYK